jgi:hypothetical protein
MSIDPTIALTYWNATTSDREVPELGDEPVAALLALLAGADANDTKAFHRAPALEGNPYAAIAVAESPAAELEQWAADVTGLIPLTCPALKDYILYVDTVVDPDGNHRVYPFVEGIPSEDMASIDDALTWMTAVVEHARGKVPVSAVEQADESLAEAAEWPWSGAEVFCHLRELPLHAAYQAWSVCSWPTFDVQTISHVSPDQPAAARLAMIVEVEQVLRSKRLARRHASLQLEEPHRVLLDYLKDLTAAVVGDRAPQIVVDTADSADPQLAALARKWLARFEAASLAVQPDPATSAQTALRTAIGVAVDVLGTNGAIDIVEGSRELLVEDLTLAAFEAGNPRIVLKKLRSSLMHSDHVEEVYINDLELEAVFRSALGG